MRQEQVRRSRRSVEAQVARLRAEQVAVPLLSVDHRRLTEEIDELLDVLGEIFAGAPVGEFG